MSIFNKFINKNQKIKNNSPRITINFLGITIRIPRLSILIDRKKNINYYHSFNSALEIPKATGNLRLIQEANLALLKDFDTICNEHNIKYWIDFGTLLGAMRHKGFIPWDDDLDVSMPREDYERFISKFKNGFPNHPDLKLVFCSNRRNSCILKLKHKNIIPIGIDIFTYDYYHSKLEENEKKDLSLKIEKYSKPKIIRKHNSFETIVEKSKKITHKFILNNKTISLENTPAIFMAIDFHHGWKNKVYDWENIFPLQKIEFENIKFNAPNNSHKVLTSIYGNYMEIPKDSYPRHTAYLNITNEQIKSLEEYAKSITKN